LTQEGQEITPSDAEVGVVRAPKKLAGLTIIPNELVNDSVASAPQWSATDWCLILAPV
jgi:hypothetical protein